MAKKRIRKDKKEERLHPQTKKNIWIVLCMAGALIFILSAVGQAGPMGAAIYKGLSSLFGLGYYLLPAVLFTAALGFIGKTRIFAGATAVGAVLFMLSALGLIDIIAPGRGGLTGTVVGALEIPFGFPASLILAGAVLIASALVMVNRPLGITRLWDKTGKPKGGGIRDYAEEEKEEREEKPEAETEMGLEQKPEPEFEQEQEIRLKEMSEDKPIMAELKSRADYKTPPLKLLISSVDKPTSGDLKANANIIRRTLESFGIPVEMGEIQIGPTVTRYTLKPAEGVKLSRITALGQDLALALAAHPVRIEAPIPGKSLVGIEVPNRAAAVVRLGSLIGISQFRDTPPLSFPLGRGVNGKPLFADIAKMPHLLIAGSTGSGKSITIHSIIISLLYKNSPSEARFILIDPKRVELSVYEGVPHLVSPVITENKKALGALKWAINEMERRYEALLSHGARDIESYHKRNGRDEMPYVLIIIDELADLMASYGREVEGAIVRLAQMSRAVGIHLIVSTQRPSVEVITGLIKANITSRVALQVASQVDSRTILDAAGAEKLLGNGDMLFASAEGARRDRIQGAYVSEKEIKSVTRYLKKHERADEGLEDAVSFEENSDSGTVDFSGFEGGDDDELYEEAVGIVRKAGKASASLLQRRLRIGYARAARLLDIMEEHGIVGPQEGSKPREVIENMEGDKGYRVQ